MTASGNGHGQLCACSATASGTDRGCHHGCELRNCSSCFRARHSLSCSTRWLGSLSSCFGWASASSDVDQILLFARAPLSEASERLCLTSCSPIQYSDTSSPTPAQLAQSIISKDPRPTLDYWYRTFSSVERDLSTSTIQPRTDNDVCMVYRFGANKIFKNELCPRRRFSMFNVRFEEFAGTVGTTVVPL